MTSPAWPAVIVHSRIWQGSNTATTGGSVTLTVAAATADAVLGKLFNFRDFYANGSSNVPLYLFDKTTGIYEYSRGTLTYGGSSTSDVISSRTIDMSSNGLGVPVAWGAGTRNAIALSAPEHVLHTFNGGSELSDLQAAAFLLRLGIIVGNTNGKIPQVGAGDLLSSSIIPYSDPVLRAITGGSNSKICRYSSAGVVAHAANTDSIPLLCQLFARGSDSVLYGSGHGVPFASVTAGVRYFLGTSGDITNIPPTPSHVGSVYTTCIEVGFGVDTNKLYFNPRLLVSGADGFLAEVPVYADYGGSSTAKNTLRVR